MTDPSDPVRMRRARIGRWAGMARGAGWTVLAVTVVVFVAGAVAGFSRAIVVAVVTGMAVASLLLAPAIVVGYGVRAAEREDR